MVLPTLTVAGMEVMVTDLAERLARAGHEIGVTCVADATGPLAARLQAQGIRVSHVAAPGVWANVSAPALRAHLARIRPDIVHVHSGCWGQASRAARQARVGGIVHTAHGLEGREPWHMPYFKRWAALHTDAIVAVSRDHRQHMLDVVRVRPDKVQVIPNGIDVERFAPGPRTGALRQRLGVGERVLIGIVARFAPVKNHALLLDAFAQLVATDDPGADLVLIGDGDGRAALEARAAALALSDRVHFAGIATDPAPWYRDLDVFVLSSDSEGTSISILEAMGSGLPVVATAVGGTPDLLQLGAGVLVPPGDPTALARGIRGVLLDADTRRTLGQTARARVMAHYSGRAMSGAYEALYLDVLRARGASPSTHPSPDPVTCAV